MFRPGRSSVYATATEPNLEAVEPVDDLVQLSEPVTATEIAKQLAVRFRKDNVYTRIGSRCIVSVRPARLLPRFSDAASKEYAENVNSPSLSPHVFSIASSAYNHMRRDSRDQSIILW